MRTKQLLTASALVLALALTPVTMSPAAAESTVRDGTTNTATINLIADQATGL